MNRLLVLDLNGTLCHVERIINKSDITRKKRIYNIYKRPHLEKFLAYAFKQFHVAVWTSREKKNMDIVIDYLFTPEQKSKLVFAWARDKCEILEDHVSIKDISFILHSPIMAKYSFSDILIIDDTYDKIRNPDHYYIISAFEKSTFEKVERNDIKNSTFSKVEQNDIKNSTFEKVEQNEIYKKDSELLVALTWLKTYDDLENDEEDLMYSMDCLKLC